MTASSGERVEQIRYGVAEGTRRLIAQRIDGRVAVIDEPVDHDDRVYLVERHVTSLAELEALCTAYAEHSERAGQPAVLAHRVLIDDLAEVVG